MLGVVTVGDGFLYLALQDGGQIPAEYFPLLFVGTNAAYLALAIPLGRLADRIGRGKVFIGGHVLLLAAYALAASHFGGTAGAICVLLLLGTFYAATDGVLAALASREVPEASRASGISAAQTVVALARFVSSIGFGLMWQVSNRSTALLVMGIGLTAVIPFAAWLLRIFRTNAAARAGGRPMITRGRLIALVVVVVLAIGGAIGYFVYARSATTAQAGQQPSVPQVADAAGILAGDHVVFRSTALGDTYGRMAVVPLADPAGPRAYLSSTCERVYATVTNGVCVEADRGVVSKYQLVMLDQNLAPTTSTDLAGLPSRARMSTDGSLVSTTTFITGHSYAESSFSTETIIRRSTGEVIGNIESFAATVDGKPLTAVDKNFWGVTFVDDDAFYATGASGGTTWLMKGSIAQRTLTSIRTDAECPSISPDHTKVAYKVRLGAAAPGQWHLAVLDLATGKQTQLAETRSVDDQVEWLDNSHVLYALPRPGSDATTTDIWSVPADGTGQPAVLVPQGSSPAVVRM